MRRRASSDEFKFIFSLTGEREWRFALYPGCARVSWESGQWPCPIIPIPFSRTPSSQLAMYIWLRFFLFIRGTIFLGSGRTSFRFSPHCVPPCPILLLLLLLLHRPLPSPPFPLFPSSSPLHRRVFPPPSSLPSSSSSCSSLRMYPNWYARACIGSRLSKRVYEIRSCFFHANPCTKINSLRAIIIIGN